MNLWQYLVSLSETLNHPFNRGYKIKTFFRIIFWKINQIFFQLPAIIEIDPGVKCICYPDSSYGGMVIYSRWAEYELMKNITSLLSKKSVYFDVGANIGDTTVIASGYTNGKIFAFEPSPVAYPRLLENVALNNLSNQIKSEKLVLSDHSGYVEFVEAATSETSHIKAGTVDKSDILKIKCVTLDVYVKSNKVSKIDLLKIDVEGAEMLVLKGANSLLKSHKISHMLIELNCASKQYGYLNSQVVNYLRSFGYQIDNLPNNIDGRIINIHAHI